MKTFIEWLELKEISSNLLARAADAAAEREDMKGDRLQDKFLRGAEKAAERASGLSRAGSWTSGDVKGANQNIIPDYSGIKYFFRGEGGKVEEGSFVIRSIKYNEYYDWMTKERRAAWGRTHDMNNDYVKPKDSSKSGRVPDYREFYVITTTKGEKVTVDGMSEHAGQWQMGEAPTIEDWDNRLTVKLDGKQIFPDRKGAVELARQINKFDYERIVANSSSHQDFKKTKGAINFKGIQPTYIKQA